MNNVQTFTHPDLGTIRIVLIDGNPWFIVSDLCNAMKRYNSHYLTSMVKSCERSKYNLNERGYDFWIVNESGLHTILYEVTSRQAKPLKEWIVSDVMPHFRNLPVCSSPCKAASCADKPVMQAEPENKAEPQPSATPAHLFTIDQYLRAAEIIAGCVSDRMDEVKVILRQAGFTF